MSTSHAEQNISVLASILPVFCLVRIKRSNPPIRIFPQRLLFSLVARLDDGTIHLN